jgi:hypothetical protein
VAVGARYDASAETFVFKIKYNPLARRNSALFMQELHGTVIAVHMHNNILIRLAIPEFRRTPEFIGRRLTAYPVDVLSLKYIRIKRIMLALLNKQHIVIQILAYDKPTLAGPAPANAQTSTLTKGIIHKPVMAAN